MRIHHQSAPLWIALLSSTLHYLALFDSLLFIESCFAASSSSSSTSTVINNANAINGNNIHTHKQSKFRIRQVQIIHRHGDRTPITPMKDEDYWYTTLPERHVLDGIARGTSLIRHEEDEEVVGAVKGKKVHGASGRGPFGQLTLLGLLQMVSLGERLREELSHNSHKEGEEIINENNFVNQGKLFTPNKPLHPRRISVMSTDFPRTIQSVQALLTGLFPDFDSLDQDNSAKNTNDDANNNNNTPNDNDNANTPIKIDVRHTTSYFIPDPQPRQSPHQLVLEKQLSNRPHLLEKEHGLKEFAHRITNELRDYLGDGAEGVSFGIGEEKSSSSSISSSDGSSTITKKQPLPWAQLSEILTCLHSRNRLPPTLTLEDVQTVSDHVAWRWFENLRHPILAKSSMWRFADQLLESMEKKVRVECRCGECLEDGQLHGDHGEVGSDLVVRNDLECQDEPWLCIYSAHDSTLIGMLCILQLEQPAEWPEYGSYLKIELIREEMEVGKETKVLNHWVRFSLNGQILRSTWMTDDDGEPASMVPLDELADMIHLEHDLEEDLQDGLGVKFGWKGGLFVESNEEDESL